MAEWWRSLVEKIRLTDPVRARAMEISYRRYDRSRAQVEARQMANVFGESQIEMDSCPMRDPDLRGTTEHQTMARRICYLCAKPLASGKRRWCSRACSDAWWTNHSWEWASSAAAKRDGHRCVQCGAARGDVLDPGKCHVDGQPWPCIMVAGAGPTTPTWPHYRMGGETVRLEVNHREPLVGRGYHPGCVHHLGNLETLCHSCHVIETTRQGRERKARRTHVPQQEAVA